MKKILIFIFIVLITQSLSAAFAAELSSVIPTGTAPVTVKLTPATYTVSSDFPVPYNVTLHFEEGARMQIADGATLYINGPIDDNMYYIFNDQNTDLYKGVKFRPGTITFVRPEWWGAKADNLPSSATVNSAAIDKAMWSYAALSTVDATYYGEYGVKVIFKPGTYYVNRTIKLKAGSSLTGEGDATDEENSAIIRLQDNSNCPLLEDQPSTVLRAWSTGMELFNMRFHGGLQSVLCRGLNLIKPNTVSGDYKWVRIRKDYFTNFNDYALYFTNIGESYLEDNVISNCARGMYLHFWDSRARNNKISVYGDYGVNMPAFDVPFYGNLIEGKSDTTTGLYISGYSSIAIISGNTIRNCYYGIRSPGCAIISDNLIENNLKHGIYVGKDNTADPAAVLSGNAMLSNNTITNNGGFGIYLDATAAIRESFIKDNIITNNAAGQIYFNPGIAAVLNAEQNYRQYPLIENNVGVDDTQINYPALDKSITNPVVAISKNWKTQNTSATTIQDFDKVPPGKEIFVYFNDSNTTLKFSKNVGPEMVRNNDFSTVPDTYWNWGTNTGWSHDTVSGQATHTAGLGGLLSQNMDLVKGEYYELKFTVQNYISGKLFLTVGCYWGNPNGIMVSANGTYTQVVRVPSDGYYRPYVGFSASSDFAGSVDNVSIKKVGTALKGNNGVDKTFTTGNYVRCVKGDDYYWDCECHQ